MTPVLAPGLALAGGIALALCQWLIFCHAPVEATLGMAQKIFYLHLPLAWWGLISFFILFVASIAYLRRRTPGLDRLCQAAGEIGLLCAVLALVSGMFWARRSWGVWWTWDPRLTTTLIMCFVYLAWLVLRGLDMPLERRRMVSAVVGVVAFLDVPLVFISARVWRSIHPAVIGSKGGGMTPEMWQTMTACIVAFGLFWAGLLLMRLYQLGLAARIDDCLQRHSGLMPEEEI